MSARALEAKIAEVIAREALYLDLQRWDDWLALYDEEAVFWVPAWTDETTQTGDPDTELSLIYHKGRASLSDRIWRLKSGMSVASTPPLRTAHVLGPPVFGGEAEGADARLARCAWSCFVYNATRHTQQTNFGIYQYEFAIGRAEPAIRSKKIVLMNERVASILDVHCV
jgi:3-phenylpropionate/cinnamic acid dioxygenase small subunit